MWQGLLVSLASVPGTAHFAATPASAAVKSFCQQTYMCIWCYLLFYVLYFTHTVLPVCLILLDFRECFYCFICKPLKTLIIFRV